MLTITMRQSRRRSRKSSTTRRTYDGGDALSTSPFLKLKTNLRTKETAPPPTIVFRSDFRHYVRGYCNPAQGFLYTTMPNGCTYFRIVSSSSGLVRRGRGDSAGRR